MKFDIIIIGDLRFPGGTSTAMASEISALAGAGYGVGVVPVAGQVLRFPHPVHPLLAALHDAGAFSWVPPDTRATAPLCVLHHPQVFSELPQRPWNVVTQAVRLVVHHPPVDAHGAVQYDWKRIDTHIAQTLGPVLWAPVGPKVREAFRFLPDAPALTPQDWVNVVDADGFAMPRTGFVAARPVIGRHSRPEAAKWPDDRATFLQAYPNVPDIAVKLMGYGPAQAQIVGRRPANWEVLEFGAIPVRQFLGSIDFFVYYHGSAWIEAFGRAILEAMAAGVVPILPADFGPLFGEGAEYARAQDVASRVRALHADARAHGHAARRAETVARERFGPQRAVSRVADLVGKPGRGGSASVKAAQGPAGKAHDSPAARVVFFTSNGVGMGHITRALAVARRLAPGVQPIVITMSKAFEVCRADGITAEYLPYHKSIGMEYKAWQAALSQELTEVLTYHRPSVFVFDGNVPYGGMIAALGRFPGLWKVWERRAMWAPGSGAQHIRHEDTFDAVIEPGEFAGALDRGLTATHRDRTVSVGPIRYLKPGEATARAAARVELGIGAEETAVLVQLGSENNFDFSAVRKTIEARLGKAPGLRLFDAEWMIRNAPVVLSDQTTQLRTFPIARLLGAFDFAVSTAGYNTFHETLEAALPTVFVPNENPEQDEQVARARFAALRGMSLMVLHHDIYALNAALEQMCQAGLRASMRDKMNGARQDNGAEQAARFISDLAVTRR